MAIIQRFGGALNLNIHIHALVLDGVFARDLAGTVSLWAALMKRTFGLDVLDCPRCGGRLRLIALIEEAVIGRILAHLGLPTDLPIARPARAPPLFAAAGEAHADEYESAPETARARAGEVISGFSRDEIRRPAKEDPRGETGVFTRVSALLRELSAGGSLR